MATRDCERRPLGRRVSRLRQARRLTQDALARLAGLSPAVVAAVEQGARRDPRLSTVLRLAAALRVSVDDLARGGQAGWPAGD
jgi:transcriptional regulator with XRE-family HTH domain